jgi:glycosyltransferase involved in cell wall biosynthesis
MAPYNHPALDALSAARASYPFQRQTLFKRALNKTGLVNFSSSRMLRDHLHAEKPDVVVISQGDNVSSWPVMKVCLDEGVTYVSVTQLVGEVHMLGIGRSNLEDLRRTYTGAARNFFVSEHNLKLNNLMLGVELLNCEVIFNPCKLKGAEIPAWPSIDKSCNVGLVGRVELYHKGYDLLLELASMDTWRNRPVRFNVYGSGPHTEVLESNIRLRQLTNIELMGVAGDVKEIWAKNHAIFLPSRIEGMSLSLIEAMWCNRVPVVTSVGGSIGLIDDGVNGFIAESATVASLNACLQRAWSARERWEEIGKNAGKAIKTRQPEDEVEYFCNKLMHLRG